MSATSTERSRARRARIKNTGRPLTSTERSRLTRARQKAANDPVKTFLQTLVDSVLLAGDDVKLSADDDRMASMAQDLLDSFAVARRGSSDLSRLWFVFGAVNEDEKAFIRELHDEAFERVRATLTALSPETEQTVAVQLATRTLTRATKAVVEGSATIRDKTAGLRACKALIAERTGMTATTMYADWTDNQSTLAWFAFLAIPGMTPPVELSDGSHRAVLDPVRFYGGEA